MKTEDIIKMRTGMGGIKEGIVWKHPINSKPYGWLKIMAEKNRLKNKAKNILDLLKIK